MSAVVTASDSLRACLHDVHLEKFLQPLVDGGVTDCRKLLELNVDQFSTTYGLTSRADKDELKVLIDRIRHVKERPGGGGKAGLNPPATKDYLVQCLRMIGLDSNLLLSTLDANDIDDVYKLREFSADQFQKCGVISTHEQQRLSRLIHSINVETAYNPAERRRRRSRQSAAGVSRTDCLRERLRSVQLDHHLPSLVDGGIEDVPMLIGLTVDQLSTYGISSKAERDRLVKLIALVKAESGLEADREHAGESRRRRSNQSIATPVTEAADVAKPPPLPAPRPAPRAVSATSKRHKPANATTSSRTVSPSVDAATARNSSTTRKTTSAPDGFYGEPSKSDDVKPLKPPAACREPSPVNFQTCDCVSGAACSAFRPTTTDCRSTSVPDDLQLPHPPPPRPAPRSRTRPSIIASEVAASSSPKGRAAPTDGGGRRAGSSGRAGTSPPRQDPDVAAAKRSTVQQPTAAASELDVQAATDDYDELLRQFSGTFNDVTLFGGGGGGFARLQQNSALSEQPAPSKTIYYSSESYSYGVPGNGSKEGDGAAEGSGSGVGRGPGRGGCRSPSPPTAGHIRVCVRKRPRTEWEMTGCDPDIVTTCEGRTVVVVECKTSLDMKKFTQPHVFTYNEAFAESCDNVHVYSRAVKPLVVNTFEGRSSVCFAYGQTGAGKTYTLLGARGVPGLFELAAADLFEMLAQPCGGRGAEEKPPPSRQLVVSYYEIYLGQLYDLLNERNRVQAYENKHHKVCVDGLCDHIICDVRNLVKLVRRGNRQRSKGSTGVNPTSSRSHAVLQIELRDVKNRERGRLRFIDLAGNERAADAMNCDKLSRFEGAEINQSLLALKECIRSIDQETSHTPYRQSKLTLLLRDCFLGVTQTVMIANVSPTQTACESTLNTLRYANRIQNLHHDAARRVVTRRLDPSHNCSPCSTSPTSSRSSPSPSPPPPPRCPPKPKPRFQSCSSRTAGVVSSSPTFVRSARSPSPLPLEVRRLPRKNNTNNCPAKNGDAEDDIAAEEEERAAWDRSLRDMTDRSGATSTGACHQRRRRNCGPRAAVVVQDERPDWMLPRKDEPRINCDDFRRGGDEELDRSSTSRRFRSATPLAARKASERCRPFENFRGRECSGQVIPDAECDSRSRWFVPMSADGSSTKTAMPKCGDIENRTLKKSDHHEATDGKIVDLPTAAERLSRSHQQRQSNERRAGEVRVGGGVNSPLDNDDRRATILDDQSRPRCRQSPPARDWSLPVPKKDAPMIRGKTCQTSSTEFQPAERTEAAAARTGNTDNDSSSRTGRLSATTSRSPGRLVATEVDERRRRNDDDDVDGGETDDSTTSAEGARCPDYRPRSTVGSAQPEASRDVDAHRPRCSDDSDGSNVEQRTDEISRIVDAALAEASRIRTVRRKDPDILDCRSSTLPVPDVDKQQQQQQQQRCLEEKQACRSVWFQMPDSPDRECCQLDCDGELQDDFRRSSEQPHVEDLLAASDSAVRPVLEAAFGALGIVDRFRQSESDGELQRCETIDDRKPVCSETIGRPTVTKPGTVVAADGRAADNECPRPPVSGGSSRGNEQKTDAEKDRSIGRRMEGNERKQKQQKQQQVNPVQPFNGFFDDVDYRPTAAVRQQMPDRKMLRAEPEPTRDRNLPTDDNVAANGYYGDRLPEVMSVGDIEEQISCRPSPTEACHERQYDGRSAYFPESSRGERQRRSWFSCREVEPPPVPKRRQPERPSTTKSSCCQTDPPCVDNSSMTGHSASAPTPETVIVLKSTIDELLQEIVDKRSTSMPRAFTIDIGVQSPSADVTPRRSVRDSSGQPSSPASAAAAAAVVDQRRQILVRRSLSDINSSTISSNATTKSAGRSSRLPRRQTPTTAQPFQRSCSDVSNRAAQSSGSIVTSAALSCPSNDICAVPCSDNNSPADGCGGAGSACRRQRPTVGGGVCHRNSSPLVGRPVELAATRVPSRQFLCVRLADLETSLRHPYPRFHANTGDGCFCGCASCAAAAADGSRSMRRRDMHSCLGSDGDDLVGERRRGAVSADSGAGCERHAVDRQQRRSTKYDHDNASSQQDSRRGQLIRSHRKYMEEMKKLDECERCLSDEHESGHQSFDEFVVGLRNILSTKSTLLSDMLLHASSCFSC